MMVWFCLLQVIVSGYSDNEGEWRWRPQEVGNKPQQIAVLDVHTPLILFFIYT